MTRRSSPARTWLARVAFGTSVLALLGTSPLRWTVHELVKGPQTAPSPDRALRVKIEGSHRPSLSYRSRTGQPDGLACAPSPEGPTKVTCLLPPGASVEGVEMDGICGGGVGGCAKASKPCAPPAGAFVRASAESVKVWRKTALSEARLAIPSRPSDSARPAHIEVVIEPDVPDCEVVLRGKGAGDKLPMWDGKPVVVRCGGGYATTPVSARRTCVFYGFEQDRARALDVAVVVEAVRYGVCADSGDEPCAAPADADLRIVSIGVK